MKKDTEKINSINKCKNAVLEKVYKTIGNPFVIFDTSYKLIAHTENNIEDDFLWNELTKSGTFSHETVNFFNKERFIEEVAISDVVSLLKSSSLKYDRLNAKIFDEDGIHIANITVLAYHKPFENQDFKNIEDICEYLSIELQKCEHFQNYELVYEENFIDDLIEGKTTDKSCIKNNLEELYSGLKNNLFIAVIDITKYEHTLTHLAYFRDLFKSIQKEFKYFIYLNNIIAIISTDNPLLNVKKDLKKINDFCIDNNIYIGISSSFQNLLELQKYYKQALNALNYGINVNLNNEHHIFEYVNCKLDCFLNASEDDTIIKDLCHPIVIAIQNHDKENKTSYYDTLCTYLSVGINSRLASEKINISHDDFCKQIRTITKTFGIDWNNGDMLLSIFLSIKIVKYFS